MPPALAPAYVSAYTENWAFLVGRYCALQALRLRAGLPFLPQAFCNNVHCVESMSPGPRLSGLQVRAAQISITVFSILLKLFSLPQRQVLSLYRTVLRTARGKGPQAEPIASFARREFER